MGASQSRLSHLSEQVSASAAALAQLVTTVAQPSNGAGAGAVTAEQDTGQPLPEGVEAVFRNKIFPLLGFGIEPPILDDAPEVEAGDSAAAASSGMAEEDEDVSAAGAAAAGASAAATKKPVWLDFTATPIRDDITPDASKYILSLRYMNRFFYQQSEPYIEVLAEQLVALVLNGREDEAKALIEACPYLLERRATVTDPVGRVYKDVTAYEAALYAGDTQMCEMMHPFFEKHRGDGEAIRFEQCRNVFPNGVKAVIDAQKPYDFDSLIQAINDALPNQVQDQLEQKVTYTALGEAINQFRNDFVTLSKQEQHANLKHLLEAFRAYAEDERITAWERAGNYDKMGVFWRQVIGFVQLYLPECDKQAVHQGLYDVAVDEKRLMRKADFKYGGGMYLLKGSSGRGFEFAAAICDGRFAFKGLGDPEGDLPCAGKLMSNKNSKLGKLTQPQTSPAKPCVIQ